MQHRRSARHSVSAWLVLVLALTLAPVPTLAATGEVEARVFDVRPVGARMATAAVGAAGADCVTRAEYRRARHGMPKRRVHRIFGTSGWLIYLVVNNEERRGYQMCDPALRLTVTYLHGELGYKRLRS
jgi:hypothetical protein